MINKITKSIIKKILLKFNLNNMDEDIYAYGLFMFLSFVIFGVIAVVFGVIFNCITESLIFYICFQMLRKYCGGYHAETPSKCEIMTSLIISICIALISTVEYLRLENILFFTSIIFFIITYTLSPVDTKENPLSTEEKEEFQKNSRIIILVMLSIVSIAYISKFYLLFVPCCVSVVLEGVLLLAGKISNSKRKIDIE